ncbi:MAG: type II toxin-antitoxin system HicA family toxin [Syntrophobacteraceae bacterium]
MRRKEGCERERKILKILQKEGRHVVRIAGSHHRLVKGTLKTTVPVHGTRDVHPKTVKSIEKDTGVKLQ